MKKFIPIINTYSTLSQQNVQSAICIETTANLQYKEKKKITAYLIMITIVIGWGVASAAILWASQLNSTANSQNDAQYQTRGKSMDGLGTEQPV